jgi:hypothetical protein
METNIHMLRKLLSSHYLIEYQTCINKKQQMKIKQPEINMFLTIWNSDLRFPSHDFWGTRSSKLLCQVGSNFCLKFWRTIFRVMSQFTDSTQGTVTQPYSATNQKTSFLNMTTVLQLVTSFRFVSFPLGSTPRVPQDYDMDKPYVLSHLPSLSYLLHGWQGSMAVLSPHYLGKGMLRRNHTVFSLLLPPSLPLSLSLTNMHAAHTHTHTHMLQGVRYRQEYSTSLAFLQMLYANSTKKSNKFWGKKVHRFSPSFV